MGLEDSRYAPKTASATPHRSPVGYRTRMDVYNPKFVTQQPNVATPVPVSEPYSASKATGLASGPAEISPLQKRDENLDRLFERHSTPVKSEESNGVSSKKTTLHTRSGQNPFRASVATQSSTVMTPAPANGLHKHTKSDDSTSQLSSAFEKMNVSLSPAAGMFVPHHGPSHAPKTDRDKSTMPKAKATSIEWKKPTKAKHTPENNQDGDGHGMKMQDRSARDETASKSSEIVSSSDPMTLSDTDMLDGSEEGEVVSASSRSAPAAATASNGLAESKYSTTRADEHVNGGQRPPVSTVQGQSSIQTPALKRPAHGEWIIGDPSLRKPQKPRTPKRAESANSGSARSTDRKRDASTASLMSSKHAGPSAPRVQQRAVSGSAGPSSNFQARGGGQSRGAGYGGRGGRGGRGGHGGHGGRQRPPPGPVPLALTMTDEQWTAHMAKRQAALASGLAAPSPMSKRIAANPQRSTTRPNGLSVREALQSVSKTIKPKPVEPTSSNESFKTAKTHQTNIKTGNATSMDAWNKLAMKNQRQEVQPQGGLLNMGLDEARDLASKGLIITSYPKVKVRSREPVPYRRVILSDLPPNFATRDVVALVYGGMLEKIEYTPKESTAVVTFVSPYHSRRFDEDAASGIEFDNHLVRVALDRDNADAISPEIKAHLDQGATRCISAVGPKDDLSVGAQMKLARENGRTVEHISVGKNAQNEREMKFRFCGIKDAVSFYHQLKLDVGWKQCLITFFDDPCQSATGIHN